MLSKCNQGDKLCRWAAAKGVGRVMSRLSKQCGDDVVCSILELLDPRHSDGAWHGGCLALAELGEFTIISLRFILCQYWVQ